MPFDQTDAVELARVAANQSPCAKIKRGVVIFTRDCSVFTSGFNHPPPPMVCDGSEQCREHCNKLCVHAEVAALRSLVDQVDFFPPELEMLHVKTVGGVVVPSGPPSCWQCSREILDSGLIDKMWLLHEDGLRAYPVLEFHDLTLRHCNLPIIRARRADQGSP